jgi:hypothetical protein
LTKYHNQKKKLKRHQNNDVPGIMAWDHYIRDVAALKRSNNTTGGAPRPRRGPMAATTFPKSNISHNMMNTPRHEDFKGGYHDFY